MKRDDLKSQIHAHLEYFQELGINRVDIPDQGKIVTKDNVFPATFGQRAFRAAFYFGLP